MAKLIQLILTTVIYPRFNIILTMIFISLSNISLNGINTSINICIDENLYIKPDSSYVIVLDAGHGGKDIGSSYKGYFEKNITLSIAEKTKEILNKKSSNLRVILTRESDVFVPLYERIRIANRARANVFISIHCNSYPEDKSVSGNEIYIMGLTDSKENLEVALRENVSILLEGNYLSNYDWYDPSSTEAYIFLSAYQNLFLNQSISIAKDISNSLCATVDIKKRGVKQAGFVILKYATMPSVLIEVGYLSNNQDRSLMVSPQKQEEIAESIADAILVYMNRISL